MTFDPATLDMLGREVVRPPFLAWLDFVGDPVRATTWEVSLRLTGTGDADLDGHLFSAINPTMGSVSGVKRATGGSETVTATLSGIVGPNSDLLNILGDETKWKGRLARLWFLTLNSAGDRVGAVVPYYTGRMVGFSISGSASQQTAKITIESYLASLTSASNRTYLDQADFVPSDTSASLTLAVANGAKTA
ncbi:hypothetical protein ACLN6N_06215 [Sphingomonas carotinifaciens]|uniref:hypothetical protein n=1 Tax=Sphingomonas carotinifaciens TaxID=1166323 RepID=UPI0039A2BE6B